MATTHDRFGLLLKKLHEQIGLYDVESHQLWGAVEEATVIDLEDHQQVTEEQISAKFGLKTDCLIVCERLPRVRLGLLLINIRCWLQTYDEVNRAVYELDYGEAATISLGGDKDLYDVEVKLSFVDPVIMEPSTVGEIELHNNKYRVV